MKTRTSILVAFIAAGMVLWSNVCLAGFMDGRDLKRGYMLYVRSQSNTSTLDLESYMQMARSFGYIEGILDLFFGVEKICPPIGIDADQVVSIVGKYLLQHPEELHLNASELVITSLIEVFPCKK